MSKDYDKQIQKAQEKLDKFIKRNVKKISKCRETIEKCQRTIKQYEAQKKALSKVINNLKDLSDKYCPYCRGDDCDMGENCDAN